MDALVGNWVVVKRKIHSTFHNVVRIDLPLKILIWEDTCDHRFSLTTVLAIFEGGMACFRSFWKTLSS